jgi:hypothetical protein
MELGSIEVIRISRNVALDCTTSRVSDAHDFRNHMPRGEGFDYVTLADLESLAPIVPISGV